MKTLRRIRTLARATLFMVEYTVPSANLELQTRKFKTQKSLNQWVDRQNARYMIMIVNRYALIDEIWEPYTSIGKRSVTLDELENIIARLKSEGLKSSNN